MASSKGETFTNDTNPVVIQSLCNMKVQQSLPKISWTQKCLTFQEFERKTLPVTQRIRVQLTEEPCWSLWMEEQAVDWFCFGYFDLSIAE